VQVWVVGVLVPVNAAPFVLIWTPTGQAGIASRFGLPVSTTHVGTGALFGIAVENRSGQATVIRSILLSWLATLPLAAVLGYLAQTLLAT